MRFANRRDAGRRLARDLVLHPLHELVVIGLPRGGVPVAAEIATALGAPLDVLVVRKLAYPRQPEIGMGVIAEDGIRIIDEDLLAELDVTPAQLEGVVAIEDAELQRRVRQYRGVRARLPVNGRTVVLVDDGVATGFTARAAIDVLRHRHAAHVVVAIPVGPLRTVTHLRGLADDVICHYAAPSFASIREWYSEFGPVGDAEVAELLATHEAARAANAN